ESGAQELVVSEFAWQVRNGITPPAAQPQPESKVPVIMGPDPGQFELTFFDDFDGDRLSDKWSTQNFHGGPPARDTWRVRNGELQFAAQEDSMFTGTNKYNYSMLDTD